MSEPDPFAASARAERRTERERAINRVTSPSGGCIGCDGPDSGRGIAAICPDCWGALPSVLQARLKVPLRTHPDARLRDGAAVAEASAYLRSRA